MVNDLLLSGGPEFIDLSENYQFARVIKLIELKEYITEEKKKKVVLDASNITLLSFVNSFLNLQGAETSETLAVEDYWNSTTTSNQDVLAAYENFIYDIRILQKTFRIWIKLRAMRAVRKIASASNEKTILIQTAARRWVARKKYANLELEKRLKEKAFSAFCVEMKKGIHVDMFSRKYGTLNKRVIKFDSSLEKIVYKTSQWHSTSIPCNAIYAVNKGLSDNNYSQGTAAHKAWCLNLQILGGKVVDIQARDAVSAKTLLEGFDHLRLLLFTQAPFYTDKDGFPRRAGPSVIQRALELAGDGHSAHHNNESAASEADHMRHRAALRLLKAEYARWGESLAAEQESWEERMRDMAQDGLAPSVRSQSISVTRSRQGSALSKSAASTAQEEVSSVATSLHSVVASSRGSKHDAASVTTASVRSHGSTASALVNSKHSGHSSVSRNSHGREAMSQSSEEEENEEEDRDEDEGSDEELTEDDEDEGEDEDDDGSDDHSEDTVDSDATSMEDV